MLSPLDGVLLGSLTASEVRAAMAVFRGRCGSNRAVGSCPPPGLPLAPAVHGDERGVSDHPAEVAAPCQAQGGGIVPHRGTAFDLRGRVARMHHRGLDRPVVPLWPLLGPDERAGRRTTSAAAVTTGGDGRGGLASVRGGRAHNPLVWLCGAGSAGAGRGALPSGLPPLNGPAPSQNFRSPRRFHTWAPAPPFPN
jgi:hypothetical protein